MLIGRFGTTEGSIVSLFHTVSFASPARPSRSDHKSLKQSTLFSLNGSNKTNGSQIGWRQSTTKTAGDRSSTSNNRYHRRCEKSTSVSSRNGGFARNSPLSEINGFVNTKITIPTFGPRNCTRLCSKKNLLSFCLPTDPLARRSLTFISFLPFFVTPLPSPPLPTHKPSKATCVSNHRRYWRCKKLPKRISCRYSKIRIYVRSMPNVSPFFQRISSKKRFSDVC